MSAKTSTHSSVELINGGTAMKEELLCKAIEIGIAATPLGAEVERAKEVVSETVEDGVKAAKRVVKKGRRAAEDLVDDAKYQIKKHPLGTVGVTFGVGLGLGTVLGILLTRNGYSVR